MRPWGGAHGYLNEARQRSRNNNSGEVIMAAPITDTPDSPPQPPSAVIEIRQRIEVLDLASVDGTKRTPSKNHLIIPFPRSSSEERRYKRGRRGRSLSTNDLYSSTSLCSFSSSESLSTLRSSARSRQHQSHTRSGPHDRRTQTRSRSDNKRSHPHGRRDRGRERRRNDWVSALPDELCLQILHYLSPREVCDCMRVCRRLNTLCNDASLWTHVEIPCRRVTSALLHKLSSKWPCLHSITLHGNTEEHLPAWEGMTGEWAQFKHLESITLIHCPSKVLDSLQNIIICCPSLKCVRCKSFSFGSQHLFALMTSGQSYTKLSLSPINDSAVYFVCQSSLSQTVFDHLSSLQALELGGHVSPYLTDVGLLPILKDCTNLKSLDIDGDVLTDRAVIYIGQHLLALERLSASCCDLTDDSLLSFAELKNLRQLCLTNGSYFTSMGLRTFFLQLAANKDSEPGTYPGLDTLTLTEFEDEIDSSLLTLGQKFPCLHHLDLSSCIKMSAAGLDALAQHCKSLITLKLNYVKCPHYKPLLGAAFPRLRYLGLYKSDLLDDGEAQQLKRARPWLKIDFAWN